MLLTLVGRHSGAEVLVFEAVGYHSGVEDDRHGQVTMHSTGIVSLVPEIHHHGHILTQLDLERQKR